MSKLLGLAALVRLILIRKARLMVILQQHQNLVGNDYNIVGALQEAFPQTPIGFDTDVNGACLEVKLTLEPLKD